MRHTGLRTTWDDHKAPELLAKLAGSGESAARQAVAVAARWDAGEARRLLFFPCHRTVAPAPHLRLHFHTSHFTLRIADMHMHNLV